MTAVRQRRTDSKGTARPSDGGSPAVEAELWEAASILRGSMDAAEYKHIILGLIFLKYVSDAFEETRAKLALVPDADPEDPDEYRAQNALWIPPEGRWPSIKAQAHQPTIGQIVDDAVAAIGRKNPTIKDVLPRDYARPSLDKTRLGRIIDLVSNIWVGDGGSRSGDVLGRVYEYFLLRFAVTGGKKGSEFYTPRSVVRLLVEMLQPYNGRVYDPCCGSAGLFVQSVESIRAHSSGNGNGGLAEAEISIWGQESNYATWQLARMNLAIHGIDACQIAHGDSFCGDQHPDLKADFILANPPFNASEWGSGRLQDDSRWAYGIPPKGNANFAWVQHMVSHLAPSGTAGFVLANESMSSNRSGEGEIRRNLVEADLVDCIVALPGQLFYSTQIPACLWFLSGNSARRGRRRGEVLFIDARRMGRMLDRIHRELTGDDITKIACTYGSWRGDQKAGRYTDSPGFCRSVKPEEIHRYDCSLTPGRYVGAKPQPDDDEPFEQKMSKLVMQWAKQQAEAERLDTKIRKNLQLLGFYGNKT